MPALVSIGDTQIMTAIRSVLLQLLPAGVEVIRGYANRVAEPLTEDFCVLSELRRERQSTNRNGNFDLRVVGSITDDTLRVVSGPILLPGYTLYGPAVAPGSVITALQQTSGLYTVDPVQTVPAGSRIYAGRHTMLQPVDIVYQCDVHGPLSDRNVVAIQTTWCDERGYELLVAASQNTLTPLFADDPRMVAFANAEAQWEDRWIIDLHTQANIVVSLGQEFAEHLHLELYPVDLFLVP